ncbi:unnamed protein product [Effrenium voratum]|nr:unnamed protein product [Effrenium voratum]
MVVHRLGLPGQQFVVKAMALRGMNAQGRLRALKEIQILKSLRHECIIEYIESWWVGAGPDSGRLTLVMECGENGDLRVPVQAASQTGRHLEEVLILSWLQQMLRGLQHVHQKEIIHRDLKAMNIFLKDTWRTCKLGDFGISTALKSGKSASGCVGTPAYMAPELLWNQRYASAVDMWAIGVVLYELMALRLPFAGSNVLSLVYQIAFNSHEDEPLRNAGYSMALIELVARLLDKDPSRRPSAAELLSEASLWDAFSFEAAVTLATASFNQSLSSRELSAARLSEGVDALMPGINVVPVQAMSGTDSEWGDAMALLGSMASDVTLSRVADQPIPASLISAETLGSVVSNARVWEEMLKTREESDAVSMHRFEELLRSLGEGSSKVAPESQNLGIPNSQAARAPSCKEQAEEHIARAAEDVASSACLQRMADEIALGSHGYEPVRRLGGSTTATVMVVHRLGLPSQQFVVKAMALRGMDAQGRLRALKEIQILKSLRHECIIEYIESWWVGAGPDSGRLTLVMECGENGDLRVPVQAASQTGRHLEEVLILSWLQQMLRGLQHVHQKEIIHRDLKAMNIFLKDTWRTCKLGDFGISTALKSGKSASGCVGTPAYMAPELLWNQRYASAVDMWAIGVVLYELMALRLPFAGSNVLSLVYQIAFNSHEDEPLRNAGYSMALIELVARLLDKDPSRRPSAAELLSEASLWDAFSFEAAVTLATASFNQSLSSRELSAARLSEGVDAPMPGINVVPVQAMSGTDSEWGDAMALLGSVADQVGLDSITGLPVPSAEAVATETFGSFVSEQQLWDGLQKSRHDCDTVDRGQLDDLLHQLQEMMPPTAPPLPADKSEGPLAPPELPPAPPPPPAPDAQAEDSTQLVARVDLFLKRRGVR